MNAEWRVWGRSVNEDGSPEDVVMVVCEPTLVGQDLCNVSIGVGCMEMTITHLPPVELARIARVMLGFALEQRFDRPLTEAEKSDVDRGYAIIQAQTW